jgi:desulfoferrodoxin-like iron-binding protein
MAEYYKCEKCDTFVKIIDRGKGSLTCCGTPMALVDEFKTPDDVLDFAIVKEQEAHDFYLYWSQKIDVKWIQEVFKVFANEEMKHKELLLKAKQGEMLKKSSTSVTDLKIVDYLVDISPTPDMDYQHALIVAMKREKASFKLYSDLVRMTSDMGVAETLQALAQEEARHKLKLETLYDEEVLIWE